MGSEMENIAIFQSESTEIWRFFFLLLFLDQTWDDGCVSENCDFNLSHTVRWQLLTLGNIKASQLQLTVPAACPTGQLYFLSSYSGCLHHTGSCVLASGRDASPLLLFNLCSAAGLRSSVCVKTPHLSVLKHTCSLCVCVCVSFTATHFTDLL